MLPSVRAMFSNIIDYAGMFPPAQLPLEEAIRNYARYRQEPESWMLGRFVCPAARLAELSPFLDELFRNGPPLAVCALGKGGNSIDEFFTSLASDLDEVVGFRRRHGQRVVVDTYEVRLHADSLNPESNSEELRTVIRASDDRLMHAGTAPSSAYYELPIEPGWPTKLLLLLHAILENPECRKGFKLRCGGTSRGAIPTVQDVAFAVATCHTRRVPLKFTAGLHHPLRHHDITLQTSVHGFLNIFTLGVLSHAHSLSANEFHAILEDKDAANFHFEEPGLRWRKLEATTATIESARREVVTSFGSCSFDEPRDGLKALGLI